MCQTYRPSLLYRILLKVYLGYSTLAYPMLKLLKGSEKVKKRHQSTGRKRKAKTDYVPGEWGREQHEAFKKFKARLTSAPILACVSRF